MRQRYGRATGAVAMTGALVGAIVSAAAPAAAVEFGPQRPSLTVVCAAAHHGNFFDAARFAQHGKWAANGKVRITISRVNHAQPEAVLHTQTGPHGWFHIRRTLSGDQHPAWVAGASYAWTTEVSGKTWAMARRGTVTLTGSC